MRLQIRLLARAPRETAPDGSEIRLLPRMKHGSLCHCTLPAGKTSAPVAHRRVEEIWYVLSGQGEIWRKHGEAAETVRVRAGTSLTIPPKTAFQFRAAGDTPLRILIVTMPPWPGMQEAKKARGIWGRNKVRAARAPSASARRT